MKNVLNQLAKSILIQLRLAVARSAMDAAIQKKAFGSGMHPSDLSQRTTFIISN